MGSPQSAVPPSLVLPRVPPAAPRPRPPSPRSLALPGLTARPPVPGRAGGAGLGHAASPTTLPTRGLAAAPAPGGLPRPRGARGEPLRRVTGVLVPRAGAGEAGGRHRRGHPGEGEVRHGRGECSPPARWGLGPSSRHRPQPFRWLLCTPQVGHDAAEPFSFHWWDHVFNRAAANIAVEAGQVGGPGGAPQSGWDRVEGRGGLWGPLCTAVVCPCSP